MIRDYRPSDELAVLDLNESNIPEVGPMDPAKLQQLAADARCFKVVEESGAITGMMIVLDEVSSYKSPNYRWFQARHERFAYVDRIALAEVARGQGLGRALYDLASEYGLSADKPALCAEINTVPNNPRSLRFHERYGFVIVGSEQPYGDERTVAMVEKTLR